MAGIADLREATTATQYKLAPELMGELGEKDEQPPSCDLLVRTPMTGSASSLNAAVSGSIALSEAMRQRRAVQQGR